MNDWEKFSENLIVFFNNKMSKRLENHENIKSTLNHILDLDLNNVSQKNISKKEKYLYKVYNGFIEIYDSNKTLKNIPKFIRSFPYEDENISKHDYLRYHIENYFNEIYLLKERLISYLNVIKKAFKNDSYYRTVYNITNPLFSKVKKPLEGIISTRGTHVHESRFRNNDLGRLETLEWLNRLVSKKMEDQFDIYYENLYKKIKKEWYERFNRNNKQIDNILSIYGKALNNIFFKSDRKSLIFPDNLS